MHEREAKKIVPEAVSVVAGQAAAPEQTEVCTDLESLRLIGMNSHRSLWQETAPSWEIYWDEVSVM